MAVQLGARLVQVADAARVLVATAWNPSEPDEVIADWFDEQSLVDLDGKKVCILPAGAKIVQRMTRGHLLNEYAISVRVIERFADRDRPPVQWLNERVQFLDVVLGVLDVTHPTDWLLGTLWTETIEVTDAANVNELMVRDLFWAEIEVTYREKAAA